MGQGTLVCALCTACTDCRAPLVLSGCAQRFGGDSRASFLGAALPLFRARWVLCLHIS